MTIIKTELIVDFGPIAPDAPEDTPVTFTVRNEGTSESWPGGQFRCPLDAQALADIRWYLEEYWRWRWPCRVAWSPLWNHQRGKPF